MLRLRKHILVLAVLLTAAFSFDGARLNYFSVEPDGADFVVTWESALEDAVLTYEVQRRSAITNNEFVQVQSVSAEGAGKTYTVRDNQVYKSSSELVDYRLQAVYTSGARQVLVTRSVNYTPTAIRRTWGSIKAMF